MFKIPVVTKETAGNFCGDYMGPIATDLVSNVKLLVSNVKLLVM